MNCIESDLYEQWFVYRDTQKFSGKLRPKGEKCLKFILTYLYCTKYDENNIGYLHIQKHGSYKKNTQKVQILCVQVDTKIF